MNLSDWAKEEMIIYGKNTDEYGKGILDSAMKAFLSLCGDGHSGMSIGITKTILDRLLLCKPLSPLTGEDSEWGAECCMSNEHKTFQNKRCSAVFKDIYPDGTIEYSDIDRFVCEDINNGSCFTSGNTNKRISHLFPSITMPYMPANKPIRLFVEDFLVDQKNGDFDHRAIFYALNIDGSRIEIDLYQAEINGSFVDITKEMYLDQRKSRINGTMDDRPDESVSHSAVSKINKQIDNLKTSKNISDGNHTFDELYYHRMMLFSIICNTYKDVAWKSWKHDDDTMYDDSFIVGVSLPNGDYSYHYRKQFWDKFDIKEVDKAPKWDGHEPEDIDRLEILVEDK